MRLYLSSFRMGDPPWPDRLRAMTGGDAPTAAVVANGVDNADPDVRRAGVERELTALAALGFRPYEIDLRAPGAAEGLAEPDLLWVRGGNVFVLRAAIARAGADDVLTDLITEDRFVYGGYSAGVCLLAPSLRGLEHCDDADAVEATYGEPARFDGLGILDRAVVPHLRSPGHPETALLQEVADAYDRDGVPYLGLADGEVVVIDERNGE